MYETGTSRPWGYFVLKLAFISVFACVSAYFAWITNNGIKPYFEEHGLDHDAAHTGLVLASCIMHGVLAILAMVFDCITAKYAWEWYHVFENACEAVLEKNCLTLFIIVIIGLAIEGIVLGLFVLFLLSMCGYVVVSSAISAV
ncbi:hypothetical protein PG997_009659 [Apiospora hydei]|uniref:Uncharacterized protein n=1 Tax=Apiospora hydei TaxID=1337664 RepID=A0ABR1VUR8_9PEZI